jgi:PhnB protein
MKMINPYLSMHGHAREAMTFYKEVFGGELTFMTMGETPMADNFPQDKDVIMHASLEGPGFMLMASDMSEHGCRNTAPDSVNICIDCSSHEEQDRFFAALSEGGTVFCPLDNAFWGGRFGGVKDKFGIDWLLNCSA